MYTRTYAQTHWRTRTNTMKTWTCVKDTHRYRHRYRPSHRHPHRHTHRHIHINTHTDKYAYACMHVNIYACLSLLISSKYTCTKHAYHQVQCVAVCCSVLQSVAVCCSLLQSVAACCSITILPVSKAPICFHFTDLSCE